MQSAANEKDSSATTSVTARMKPFLNMFFPLKKRWHFKPSYLIVFCLRYYACITLLKNSCKRSFFGALKTCSGTPDS